MDSEFQKENQKTGELVAELKVMVVEVAAEEEAEVEVGVEEAEVEVGVAEVVEVVVEEVGVDSLRLNLHS